MRPIFASALVVATTMALASPTLAQTSSRSQPGFNLFSVRQDVEIGRQAAAEVESQLPLLNDASVNRYLNRLIQRLAAQAPGADYPYQIKAVNAEEINAFALPGGPMYVNRGLILAARSEAELAGVLAHELSHVALRHGTKQASKASLGQAGLGILGGLLGKESNSAKLLNGVGGFGLNAAFLKFSRDDESRADATGAQIMAGAGYDPTAMADFFGVLREQQGRDPGKLERFFASHPPPADREARIRQLATNLRPARVQEVGGLASIQTRIGGTALAAARPQLSTSTAAGSVDPNAPVQVNIPAPSTRFTRFEQPAGLFTIAHPDNWRAYAASGAFAVSLAPAGGVVEVGGGPPAMVYGVIVNHYAPFEDESDRWSQSLQRNYAPFEDRTTPRGALEDATDDLIRQILRTNAYLRAETGSARAEQIDGSAGYSVVMSGPSPVTGEEERVTAYTRELTDGHVLYALCIAPTRAYSALDAVCTRMLRSLLVNEQAAHRSTRTTRPRTLRQ